MGQDSKNRLIKGGKMFVGIPREKKNHEYRVGGLPETVSILREKGHRVLVESGAGQGIGLQDRDYSDAGAEICSSPEDIYSKCQLVVKVKEPLPEEYPMLREEQIIFTFFHFASDRKMTEILLSKKVHCFAYELVEEEGAFPILAPMSEIAGRLAPQQGAKYIEKEFGGKGVLLSGGLGARKGRVVVIGGGIVGMNAASISCGMGAEVSILEISPARIEYLENLFKGTCRILQANRENKENEIRKADIIIGAVMIPGKKAPTVIGKEDLLKIEDGSVLVDVAIDQGGCFETSRPTNHNQPIFTLEGVIHYCVPNMPGVVPRTSTYSLVAAATPYTIMLADKGIDAPKNNMPLSRGYAIGSGKILNSNIITQ